jgi:hypothetical protein
MQSGDILRNGKTDTALILKDNRVLELKRAGISYKKDARKIFPTVEDWSASLTSPVITVNSHIPRERKIDRIFKYTADVPHWQIAKDLLDHFGLEINTVPITSDTQNLIKATISLLKLDLEPPELPLHLQLQNSSVKDARIELMRWTNILEKRIASDPYGSRKTRYYGGSVNNRTLFVKSGDQLFPLSVNVDSKHIILGQFGYSKFSEVVACDENGLPEFWATWNHTIMKINVSIVPNLLHESCVMLPFEYKGITYMRVGRKVDNYWASSDLWQNNYGVKGAYVGCILQDGSIDGKAISSVWAREYGPDARS